MRHLHLATEVAILDSMPQKPTLVIGDCHGHYDRLIALLEQEGIIAWDSVAQDHKRINHDVEVVQLGDLGHFGKTGSPSGDEFCWLAANDGFIDIVLWGNHDRAVVDRNHAFTGYEVSNTEVFRHFMAKMIKEDRLKIAYAAHGWLLTHAGLHASFKHNRLKKALKTNVESFVNWINHEDGLYLTGEDATNQAVAIVNAIGHRRGGGADAGGLLWRDFNEKIYPDFPQVFGHSKGRKVRHSFQGKGSWCVDVGGPDNGMLAGIWLPQEKVVGVNTNIRNAGEAYVR